MLIRLLKPLLALLLVTLAATAPAQQASLPYWASLSADEVNLRVGPSETYPVEWVYARRGLPLRVVRVNQGWRLVEDPDGVTGWMAAALLSRDRGAIVVGSDPAAMRAGPSASAPLRWHVAPGVSGRLGDCASGWCEFEVRGHRAYVEQVRLWGAGEP